MNQVTVLIHNVVVLTFVGVMMWLMQSCWPLLGLLLVHTYSSNTYKK